MHRILYLCFGLGLCAAAQSKADFTGVWKLNAAASDFSDHGAVPDRYIRTLRQSGNTLRYKEEWARGDSKSSFDIQLKLGGPPDVSDAAGIVTVEKKDATLLVKILYNPGTDREAQQTEIWSLSGDGKQLLDQTTYRTAKGREFHLKRVFDKQP